MDDAIRYLYEALETLRGGERSPQHSTVMSNLAAALVTVGDYAPARELAEAALAELANYNNAQLVLFARSNLAEALTRRRRGRPRARSHRADARRRAGGAATRRAESLHGHRREILARHGRVEEAARCAETARAIYVGFSRRVQRSSRLWADAVVADAQERP